MIKYAIAVAASVLAVSPANAAGNWFEATSDHFKVYSEGTKEDAVKLATNLERLDNALRMIRGLPTVSKPAPDAVKLTVFQFGETSDIAQLYGNSRSGVAGFFIPRAGRSVAFVPLRTNREIGMGTRTDPDDIDPAKVLFHEYTHYFMFQNAAAAYPFWYTEGFAELFGTLQLTDKGFNLGEPPEHRADALRYLTIDVRKLFDPPKEWDYAMVAKQYAYGWMAVSYLSFEPSRKGQIADYLKRINAGEENLVAAEHGFGDLGKLQKELEAYKKGRVRAIGVTYANYAPPAVTVRAVGEDEASRMRMHIRSSRGVTKSSALGLVDGARQLVAQYPNSVPVLVAATEAEFDAGNYDRAEQLAKKTLGVDPKSVDAHLYLAQVALERAKTDPAQFKIARANYIAANNLDPNQPLALAGYYVTYELAGETPPEDALIALDRSYDLAPFDSGIRMTLAHQLLLEKRDPEALMLLGPITNDPHSSKRAEKFRVLVDKLKAGDRAPLIAKLAPKIDPEDDEEDGD
jgi:tetratricopeptide (TPR) repeat protein